MDQSEPPKQTPQKKKSSSRAVSAKPPELEAAKTQMVRDIRGEYVGPMPVEEFLEKFVPDRTGGATPPVDLEENKMFFSDVPTTANESLGSTWDSCLGLSKDHYRKREGTVSVQEKDMYKPIKDAIQLVLTSCTVVVTANHSDSLSDAEKKWRPDVSVYRETPEPEPSLEEAPTQLDKAELLIEIKTTKVKVFGGDPPFIVTGKPAEEARGQIALALTEQMNRQWRTFVFFVLITDPSVYLIRADRTGLIVSAPINFRTEPVSFLKFLWRYNHLSAEERGQDPSVRLVTDLKDIALAKEKLSPHVSTRKQGRPIFAVQVPDTTKPREVLVWGSLYDAESLTGRCTRVFAAWDREAAKVQFLKDMWRTDTQGMEKESEILRTLNSASVEHVPTLVAGDDVPGTYQRTVTQEYTKPTPDWVKSEPDALDMRTHHRLLENFIPTLLEDFKSPKQFLQVLFDGFMAHKGAYARGFLHRDVSDNNIMIDENGRGVLIDWELAIRVKDENGTPIDSKARQRYRTGTWAFMSCNLLGDQDSQTPHALPDDQQSFLWIGLYYILLAFKPVIPRSPNIEGLISKHFEENHYDRDLDYFTGGLAKSSVIRGKDPVCRLTIPNNKPMEEWFKNVLEVFSLADIQEFLKGRGLEQPSKELKQPDLDQHDALERIFRESLDAEGWSATREPKNGRSEGIRNPLHTGTATTKRPAPPNDDGDDAEIDQASGSKTKRLRMSKNEDIREEGIREPEPAAVPLP